MTPVSHPQLRIVALLAALGGACDVEHGGPLDPGREASAVTAENGLTVNGVGHNGIHVNGFSLNGVAPNGLSFNGLSFNGLSFNGLSFNGLSFNSLSLNSLSFNGLSFNGAPLTTEQEQTVDALLYHLVGCALPAGESVTIDGIVYEGLRGFAPGWEADALSDDGNERVRACLESATSTGLTITDALIPLNDEERARVTKLLRYMIECALPAGDSVTIDGQVFDGALGLAPEWKTQPPTTAGQRNTSACLAARANANEQHVQVSLRGLALPVSAVETSAYRWHEGAFWADLFGDEPYVRTCAVDGGVSGRVCTGAGCGFDSSGDCAQACASRGVDGAFADCGGEADPFVLNTFLNLGTGITSGSNHNCLKIGGDVWCWGYNAFGEVGDGTMFDDGIPEPQPVSLPESATEIAAGGNTTCARLRDGSLWCWGQNHYQIIDPDPTTTAVPLPKRQDALGYDVATAEISDYVACAVKTDGSLWCWGWNELGQVGDGTTNNAAQPVEVTGLPAGVASISVGPTHTCAVLNDASLYCWGENLYGEVGGTADQQLTPYPVASAETASRSVTDVCTGQYHTCLRRADGTVSCWGWNKFGQLGDGTTRNRTTPVEVLGGVAPNGLGCGLESTCALMLDGTVRCWGRNRRGEVGDGGSSRQSVPTAVVGPEGVGTLTGAIALHTGDHFACTRHANGENWCWGDNGQYQLASTTAGVRSSVPVFADQLAALAP